MSIDPNTRIKDYIRSYRTDTRPFALLIDGAWGSGKTFLVRNAMGGSTSHLHISLNGTKEISDVLDRLYYEAYPVLADKTVRALGSVAKTIAGAFRVKSEISKEDLLAIDRFDTLIFDDFERSQLAPELLMGFINTFVERDPKRVIIIANTREIDQTDSFVRIKEKVVGRTLAIQPNFGAFYNEICRQQSSEYASFLRRNEEEILAIFSSLEMKNLRALGYCIDDFDDTFDYLSEREVSEAALKRPFLQFVILSYFFRIGSIEASDISEVGSESLLRAMRRMKDDYVPDLLDSINEKIADIDIVEQHLDIDYLKAYILEGVHVPEYLERTAGDLLGKSDASLNPDWRNLWYLIHQSDAVIRESYKSFIEKFRNRAYDDAGVIIHAFGLLFTLQSAGLIRWSDERILEESMKYVDDLYGAGTLPILGEDFITSFRHGSAHGLGFYNLDKVEMQRAVQHYRNQSAKLKWETIQKELKATFSQDDFDVDGFKAIILDGQRTDNLYGTPALHHIDAKKFVGAVLKQPEEKRWSIMLALRSRYSTSPYPEVRINEAPWLRRVVVRILERAESASKLQNFKLTELVRMTLTEFVMTSQPPPPRNF